MSNKIVQFNTDDGDSIYIETEEVNTNSNEAGFAAVGLSEDEKSGINKASSKFEKALEPVKRVSNHLIQNIKDIQIAPDEISIELGLKFSAEAGMIISKASTEGNIKVNLSWKKPEQKA